MSDKKIFISYNRKDEAFALQVHEFLVKQGYRPWIDVYDIPRGTDPEANIIGWDDAIDISLRDSDVILGIISPESVASHNVLNEWGWAISHKKPLVLIFLRECEIPHRYARVNYIDFRKNPSKGFQLLSKSLDQPRVYQETFDERNRRILIGKVKDFWINGVLQKSLYSDASIEIGMETLADVIEHPWKLILETENNNQAIPSRKNILDVFADMQSALLILGKPGSGKTITLLELARDAIAVAETDVSHPIPVVFNLSTWTRRYKSIENWLVNELRTKYQIPTKVGQRWIEEDALMLLLDGLDEVEVDTRNACIGAINRYREEHGLVPVAICSRIEDYKNLTSKLKLNGAILIKSLNHEQIDFYLSNYGEKLDALRQALKIDENLRELAKTPLMLNIMCLTYNHRTMDEVTTSVNESRITQAQLITNYINTMFNRFGRSKSEQLRKDEIMRQLGWLANKMLNHNQSLFLIEQLQPSWLQSRNQQWLYIISTRLIGGLFVGFAPGLILYYFIERLEALFVGLLIGVYGGIVIGLLSRIRAQITNGRDQNKQSPSNSRWKSSIRFLGSTLSLWLSLFLLLLLISLSWLINQHPLFWSNYRIAALGIALYPSGVLSFLVATLLSLFFGLKTPGENLELDIVPDERIRWSWNLAWRGLIAGSIIGIIFGIVYGFLDSGTNPAFSPWLLLQDIQSGGEFLQQIINMPGWLERLVGWGDIKGTSGPFTYFDGSWSIVVAPPFGLLGGLIGGFQGRTIDTRSTPNQGIRLAFRNAVIAGTVTGLPIGIFSPSLGLLIFLMIFLWYGGLSVTQHITLRVILAANNRIPLFFARFLDYAVDLILLRKVGGGYIFIHRYLLEHFAKLDADKSV